MCDSNGININFRGIQNLSLPRNWSELVLPSMDHNFLVRARHVPGVSNEIADALSRFQMPCFWGLAPAADQIPFTIPPSLMTV